MRKNKNLFSLSAGERKTNLRSHAFRTKCWKIDQNYENIFGKLTTIEIKMPWNWPKFKKKSRIA